MPTKLQYILFCVASIGLFQPTRSAVIQALIDFDDDSEDLIGSLISKVDNIVDPVKNDMKNVSLSLAQALLKLAPTVTIKGNVSDGANSVTLTFSFSATTDEIKKTEESITQLCTNDEENHIWKRKRGGVLEPIVVAVEPWVLFILEVAAHSILGVILTQILHATSLLENVPIA